MYFSGIAFSTRPSKDNLGWLIRESNPKNTGTITSCYGVPVNDSHCYTYDGVGNLIHRTGAKNVLTLTQRAGASAKNIAKLGKVVTAKRAATVIPLVGNAMMGLTSIRASNI